MGCIANSVIGELITHILKWSQPKFSNITGLFGVVMWCPENLIPGEFLPQ